MNISTKDKKILGIFGAILAVIAIAAGVLFVVGGKTESPEELQALQSKGTLQAINVEEPSEPFHKDKNDDPHINVDMRGNKIKEAKIEVPVKKKTKNKEGKEVTTYVNEQRDAPTAEEMDQVTNFGGLRFKVPALGVDVPFGMVNEVDGILRPTNFTAAFGVRNRGVNFDKTENGTSYVVTHTVDYADGVAGLAPGNYFFNGLYTVDDPKVKNGDEIIIENNEQSTKFIVTDHYREGKAVVMGDDDLWDAEKKDRLVLIICAPNSFDNYVVVAKRA